MRKRRKYSLDLKNSKSQVRMATLAAGLLAACVLLAACGGGSSSTSDSTTAEAPEATEAAETQQAGKPMPQGGIPTEPFVQGTKVGIKPNLPHRIAFTQPESAEFEDEYANGVKVCAEKRGLEFLVSNAEADASKSAEQTSALVARGLAGLVSEPVEPKAAEAAKQQAIEEGVMVGGTAAGPTTIRLSADQYAIGHVQGEAAAKWIDENLNGKSQVYIANEDDVPVLKPRTEGLLDALKEGGPGIEVVVNQTVHNETTEYGFQTANTVLQAHPDVNVWLGSDSQMIGVLSALEAAGKVTDSTYLSGVNGEKEALAKVREGGPYKATVAFAFPVGGCALANYTADWLEGKTVPQVLFAKPILLESKAELDEFEKKLDPSTFDETFEEGNYLEPKGNTSYEHNKYLTKEF